MGSHLRRKFLAVCPNADLNLFRIFPDERICTDWTTMLKDFTVPPHPYLSSWPVSEQLKAMNSTKKDWKKYDTHRRYANEVPLPADGYARIKVELEAYEARQLRIHQCKEAGVEYHSDEEAASVANPAQSSPIGQTQGDKGKQTLEQKDGDIDAEDSDDHIPLSVLTKDKSSPIKKP